jgi:hypothetical protein
VGRHDLDIEMVVVAIEVVLDAQVGEMDAVVEVRQIVLVRPELDLVRVAIGPSITVGAFAIPLVQEALVPALQLAFGDDVSNLGVATAEFVDCLPIGVVDAGIMGQLTPVDAVRKALAHVVVALAYVELKELAPPLGEDDAAVSLVERYGRDQAFVAQVLQAVGTRVQAIAQIALGDDTERSDGGEVAAILAVELVCLIAVPDDFPIKTAREVHGIEEHVARISRIELASVPAVVTFDLALVVIIGLALARVGIAERRRTVILLSIASIDIMRVSRIVAPSRIVAAEHGRSSFAAAAALWMALSAPADVRGRKAVARNADAESDVRGVDG